MPGDEESMTDEAIWETLPVRYDLFHLVQSSLKVFLALLFVVTIQYH